MDDRHGQECRLVAAVLVSLPLFDVCVDDGGGLAAAAAEPVDHAADAQHEEKDCSAAPTHDRERRADQRQVPSIQVEQVENLWVTLVYAGRTWSRCWGASRNRRLVTRAYRPRRCRRSRSGRPPSMACRPSTRLLPGRAPIGNLHMMPTRAAGSRLHRPSVFPL